MIRIAYCTPSLHIPGGVERVLTTKANYLAENGNYDIPKIRKQSQWQSQLQ